MAHISKPIITQIQPIEDDRPKLRILGYFKAHYLSNAAHVMMVGLNIEAIWTILKPIASNEAHYTSNYGTI